MQLLYLLQFFQVQVWYLDKIYLYLLFQFLVFLSQRLIYLNEVGLKLYDEIFSLQKRKIYNALKSSDADSVMKFKNLMKKITYE